MGIAYTTGYCDRDFYKKLPRTFQITSVKNPWLAIAGKYADDPTWDEYQASIESARQEANAAEDIYSFIRHSSHSS